MKYILVSTMMLLASVTGWAQTSSDNVSRTTVAGKPVKPGGFYAEPFVSLSRDDSSIRTSQVPMITGDTSGRVDGAGFGTRLGVHASETVFIGVDARYQRSRIADSFYQSADGNLYNFGPMIGGQMPWYGLRGWAEYVIGGEFDPTAGRNGFDVRFRDPRGYRLGAGLHYLNASVNLEFQDLVYDTTQIQSLGRIQTGDDTRVDFTTRGFIVSLSFPMEL